MIVVEESHNQVILRLPTEFNFKLHQEFRKCYQHRPSGLTYIIDFQDVTCFDSSALGMLLLLRSHCGDERADIHLVNCSAHIGRILATARFDSYFHIAATPFLGWWPGK
ncbi:MAG: STAS domain-containing protein [Magnetococcales bacterium]|nr:STAS domain-containing protein [Magnetococcales bacterium]